MQAQMEMLEQEEIGMIQVGQKESGMIRAGMKVLGKSKVGNLPNNPKENPKLNKVKMVHMWVLCSISVSTSQLKFVGGGPDSPTGGIR